MKRRKFITAVRVRRLRGRSPSVDSCRLRSVAVVRQEWLDRREEPILEPDLPIVDPHHHLWIGPGWRYLIDALLADINSGHNVATVYVQARWMYRETGPVEMRPVVNGVAAMFASGILGRSRACSGIVGQAD